MDRKCEVDGCNEKATTTYTAINEKTHKYRLYSLCAKHHSYAMGLRGVV